MTEVFKKTLLQTLIGLGCKDELLSIVEMENINDLKLYNDALFQELENRFKRGNVLFSQTISGN